MSSYTHECASCGQQMTVHERYYGRTLRCRECGEKFLADPSGSTDGMTEVAHTCLACGNEMSVAARYVGRELSCTECGERFTPRPPVQLDHRAELEDTAATGTVAVDEEADRWWNARRTLSVACVVVVVGLLVWWLGGDREEGFGGSLFRAQKAKTEIGELRYEQAAVVPVALDRESAEDLERIVREGDSRGGRPAIDSPSYLQIEAGTRVRVIETHRDGQARVRVLSGPQNSRIVWVPIDWVK